jgi:hypothetical protein
LRLSDTLFSKKYHPFPNAAKWERVMQLDCKCVESRLNLQNEENLLSALAAPTTLQGVSKPLNEGYTRLLK